MKKRKLLILLFVLFVEIFTLKDVYARENHISHNIGIDYRFSVQDENGNDVKDLQFSLYDKTGSLSFDFEYDANSNQYILQEQDYNYKEGDWSRLFHLCFGCDVNEFNNYIRYKDELLEISNEGDFNRFLNKYSLHGNFLYDYLANNSHYNYYSYIPLVLEEMSTHKKKIILASENITFDGYGTSGYYDYYAGVYLFNHLNISNYDFMNDIIYGNDSFKDNVEFMRNAVYDYSDELWEELNNGPIASSEMSFDNSSVVIDSSDSGANNLSTPSIIQLNNKVDTSTNNSNNEDNNIINVITNPQTWNSGVVILIISIFIIIGSCFIIIKKKNKHIVN